MNEKILKNKESIQCDKVELFELGDLVYHRANSEKKGVITCILRPTPESHYYWVTWDDLVEKRHYPYELTKNKSF
jgi:hypothetical protein